jgi:hypothetical protein
MSTTLNRFYSTSVDFTDKTAPNYKTKVWFDEEQDIIKFNPAQFAIDNPEKIAANNPFNEWEINVLVEVLLREIRKCYDGDEAQCIENSFLYSVMYDVGKIFPRQTYWQLLKVIAEAQQHFGQQDYALRFVALKAVKGPRRIKPRGPCKAKIATGQ